MDINRFVIYRNKRIKRHHAKPNVRYYTRFAPGRAIYACKFGLVVFESVIAAGDSCWYRLE